MPTLVTYVLLPRGSPYKGLRPTSSCAAALPWFLSFPYQQLPLSVSSPLCIFPSLYLPSSVSFLLLIHLSRSLSILIVVYPFSCGLVVSPHLLSHVVGPSLSTPSDPSTSSAFLLFFPLLNCIPIYFLGLFILLLSREAMYIRRSRPPRHKPSTWG